MAAVIPQTEPIATVAATLTTRSAYVRLAPGRNRVSIWSTSWSGSKSIAVKYCPIDNDDSITDIKFDASTAATFTANDGLDLFGPGIVCFDTTNANAAPTNMMVAACEMN